MIEREDREAVGGVGDGDAYKALKWEVGEGGLPKICWELVRKWAWTWREDYRRRKRISAVSSPMQMPIPAHRDNLVSRLW